MFFVICFLTFCRNLCLNVAEELLTSLDEFSDKKQKKWGLPTFRLVLVKCGGSIARVTPVGNNYGRIFMNYF